MLTSTRIQLRALGTLIPVAVLCLIVSSATIHGRGLAHVVSWITFVGFWVSLLVIATLVILMTFTTLRGRRAVRS
jgi:hypothetical protein